MVSKLLPWLFLPSSGGRYRVQGGRTVVPLPHRPHQPAGPGVKDVAHEVREVERDNGEDPPPPPFDPPPPRQRKPCPRGGKKLRKKKKDKAVAPPPSQDVGEGDGEGAEGDWEVTDTPAHSGLDAEASEVISLMAQGSLSNLASQDCQRWRGDTMSGAVSFVSAINYIQLTAKVTSIVRAKKDRPKLTKTRVWELYASKDCKKKTFMGWVNNGTKYAHLAGAGSIYFLMIVAMRGQRSKITSMHWNSISAIANALRCPPADTDIGKDVTTRIIPLVSYLRSQIPLSLSTMFSTALLQQFGLPSEIDCGDLRTSAKFFDIFPKNAFKSLEFSPEAWGPCLDPLPDGAMAPMALHLVTQTVLVSATGSVLSHSQPSTRPISPLSDSDNEREPLPQHEDSPMDQDTPDTLRCYKTKFQPEIEDNHRIPYPTGATARRAWTDEQREYASRAPEPATFQNFCENLEDLYGSKGTKKRNTYVTLTDQVIDGHDTLLYGADNSLLAFVAGDMPAEMQDSLERNLRNAFVVEAEEDCVLQPHDSATAEE
ncbi:hypothetical protein B0H21DRAFT_713143, partial [Amylocystis lapponica]